MKKKFVAGNWKMNGSLASLDVVKEISVEAQRLRASLDTIMYLPSLYIHHFIEKEDIKIGAQNCHYENNGAFTGEISAEMLKDIGAVSVILGHSERRTGFHETSEMIREKAQNALKHNILPVICVGESEEQYRGKLSIKTVAEQIKSSVPENDGNIAIGYEPIWAIGTGLIPELNEIEEMHYTIRETLSSLLGKEASEKVNILYGGSVKPENAREIAQVNNVDGALVGGASLKAKDFIHIMNAFS